MANIFSKSKGFLSDSYEELKKVSTPSKEETKRATLFTIAIVIAVAFLIFVIDYIFSNISGLIIPSVNG